MRLALARGTDSATNRESITVLQLCSTQRRLTGLRPAHPRLSRHSHSAAGGSSFDSHLKAPCVTWPARKTIGHALGVSETFPQTEKAGGAIALTQNVAGVHGDVGNLRQVDGGRTLAGQRQRRLVCPGQEPVSRSIDTHPANPTGVAAHSRDPGIAQKPPRPGGTSLSCQATLTESTQPRAKGLPPVGDFFIGPECME